MFVWKCVSAIIQGNYYMFCFLSVLFSIVSMIFSYSYSAQTIHSLCMLCSRSVLFLSTCSQNNTLE